MPSRSLTDLDPKLAIIWAESREEFMAKHPAFPEPFITCTYRSNAEQAELYAQGRTKPGRIVTNAKPGTSKHNTLPSKAFDIAFKFKDDPYKEEAWFDRFAEIAKPKGAEWGGDFKGKLKDKPHFQI